MQFVDAHHHFWDLDLEGYEFWKVYRKPGLEKMREGMESLLGNYESICHNFLPADLERIGRPIGLLKSVNIETSAPSEWLAEAKWAESLNKSTGLPSAHIAGLDLMAADVADRIDQLRMTSTFRGVRSITFMDPGALYKDSFWNGLAALDRHGLVLDGDFDWTVFPVLSAIADRFKNLKIVLGHAGFPKRREPLYFKFWSEALHRLAENPRIHCKISGFGMADHTWTEASIAQWVKSVIDAFGPERVMFGSNFPVDALFSSYQAVWDAYDSITSDRSEADRTRMFITNAEQFYSI